MIGVLGFRKNPRYLLANNNVRISLIGAVNVLLICTLEPPLSQFLIFLVPMIFLSAAGTLTTGLGLLLGLGVLGFQNDFHAGYLWYSALALFITFPVTGLFHACTHEALKPKWLNRFLGELCGLVHATSLDEWSVIHSYHHRYSDDPVKDPHPPLGQAFVPFASTMGTAIKKSFFAHYLEAHPGGEEVQGKLKTLGLSILARQLLLTLFWYLALGPVAFVYFFGANIVFKKVHYAWFNWATHVQGKGSAEIVNQNTGIYWLVNLISFNLYFHKNHHLQPALLSPKRLGDAGADVESMSA